MMKSLLNIKKCFMLALFVTFVGSVMAQSITVTGTVKDTSGGALMGVTVTVDGTTTGTATDVNGGFSIKVPNSASVLSFSYIGYAEQQIVVGAQTKIDVVLAEDATALEDVIVIGYGTIKKSDVTGAVSHIGTEELKERPVQNALQAMQGKLTGVDITSNDRPGELGSIQIRGSRSLSASNAPLYVVDGIPLIAATMSEINPANIESIDVLKDASATAIYGSRGANGVILITTKTGSSGKVSMNYDGSLQFTWLHSLADWFSSGERLDWQRQGYLNADNYQGRYGTAPDPLRDWGLFMGNEGYMKPILATAYSLRDMDPNQPNLRAATSDEIANGYAAQVPIYNSGDLFDLDWGKSISATAVTQNHQISLSAGTDKSRLYASVGYLDQKSPKHDQDYRRFTFTVNGDIQATKFFKMGLNISANYADQQYGVADNGNANGGAQDSYGMALAHERYAPIYNEDGSYLITNTGPSKNNTVADLDLATNERLTWAATISSFAEAQITPWLKYRLNFGTQYRQRRNGNYYEYGFSNPLGAPGSEPGWGYYNSRLYHSWTLDNLIYFDKTFGKHSVSATLLQSAEGINNEMINIRSKNLLYDFALWYNLSANSDGKPQGYGTNLGKETRSSYMTRVHYAFNDKYLLTLTGRWDGASVLAAGHKWSFFPSVALAWRLDQEEFMKSQDLLSQLKLRFGYGETGNASVSAYTTTGTIYKQNYTFNEEIAPGSKPQEIPNPDLTWERTAQKNIGLDFGLLNNRISASVELYQSDTKDLIMNQVVAWPTGVLSVKNNSNAQIRNKGVEVTLTTKNISNRDFQWTTNWSFTANKQEFVKTALGKVDDVTSGHYIGYPTNKIRTYEYDKIWSTSDEDARMRAIYYATNNYVFLPGQGMVKDQQAMILASQATQDQINEFGTKTINISYENNAGETINESISYLNNGFGKIDDKDNKIIGHTSPKWYGGITNTFTYKNFQLSFYIYARWGILTNSWTTNYGKIHIDSSELWSEDNQSGIFYQPRTGGLAYTAYNGYKYVNSSMVAIRNISLAYNVPEKYSKRIRLTNAQVYAQIHNPFIFGQQMIKYGLNPDDQSRQSDLSTVNQSFVLGLRFGIF